MSLINYADKLQHIGIPTAKPEEIIDFLKQVGFTISHIFQNEGHDVMFLEGGGIMLEVWYSLMHPTTAGKIDHLAFNVNNVQKAYEIAKLNGFTIIQGNIEHLPFFENGVRFFTIEGPEQLRIEFSEVL